MVSNISDDLRSSVFDNVKEDYIGSREAIVPALGLYLLVIVIIASVDNVVALRCKQKAKT